MTFFFVNYWPKKSVYWWKTSWRCDFQWFWWVFKSFSGSIRHWTMLFLREIFAKSLFIWCSRNFAHVDCWNSNAGQFFKMFFGFFWKIFKAHSSSSFQLFRKRPRPVHLCHAHIRWNVFNGDLTPRTPLIDDWIFLKMFSDSFGMKIFAMIWKPLWMQNHCQTFHLQKEE